MMSTKSRPSLMEAKGSRWQEYLIDNQLPFRQKNWCQKDSSVILQPSFCPSFFCPFSGAAPPFSAENVR